MINLFKGYQNTSNREFIHYIKQNETIMMAALTCSLKHS
jgi:hypothetical protein